MLLQPITKETTERNARSWLNIIRYGESGTVIQLQDDCEYRVKEILENTVLLRTNLGPFYKKYLFSYVSVDSQDLLGLIHDALLTRALDIHIGTKGILEKLNSIELLYEIGQKGYEVGVFISHVSDLFRSNTIQQFIDLESLIRMSRNFSVIVFSEVDITHPSFMQYADKGSFLFEHIISYPLYERADVHQFIQYYISKWNFVVSERIINEIEYKCGGYLWLIHHVLLCLRDNPLEPIDFAYKDSLLLTKLASIWEKLERRQREILRRIYFGTLTEVDRVSHEYMYLFKIRFIVANGESNQLGIPLLSQVIENEMKLSKWHVKDSKIFIGGKNLTDIFTKKERKILVLLIRSKKNLVSRDSIAISIWGDNFEEKYSDWAIDRLMFRIRIKLKKIGEKFELLKTVKKKGYIFG